MDKEQTGIITEIPEVYEPLFHDDYTYYVFYGGRGGGKTENVAQSLVLLSCMKPLRILCVRESQSSLAESVMRVIEKWIHTLDLSIKYKITGSSIVNVDNGSEFIFLGMRNSNAVNVKSINDINITWIEEAEAFSKRSWTLLVPSVTRTKNPKIIITFNPNREEDIIYETFVKSKPPPSTYIRKLNYMDNPFFANSHLEQIRQHAELTMNADDYNHIWLGEIKKHTEESIFKDCNFTPLDIPYNPDNYSKTVLAIDPATTDKEFSNENGIIIAGKHKTTGEVHILADLSGKMSPNALLLAIDKAYNTYKIDYIVVETNNGGDFIKALIIQHNALYVVKEVRASQDKVNRAMPVSSLMSQNKIHLLHNMPELIRQMKLLTSMGFLGAKGESPDRLDAMVWSIYDLFELKTSNTVNTLFKHDWLIVDYNKNYYSENNAINIALTNIAGYTTMLKFKMHKPTADLARIVFLDAVIANSINNIDFKDVDNILITDLPVNENIYTDVINLQQEMIINPNVNIVFIESSYNSSDKSLDKALLNTTSYFKSSQIITKYVKPRMFNGYTQNLLSAELSSYMLTDLKDTKATLKKQHYLLYVFSDIIHYCFSIPIE